MISKQDYDIAIDFLNKNLGNCFECEVGRFDPASFMGVRSRIAERVMAPTDCYLATDVWATMIAGKDWQQIIDPVKTHTDLLLGKLGLIFGMTLWCDNILPREDKFLKPGEIIMMNDKRTCFSYVRLIGVDALPPQLKPLSRLAESVHS